MPVLAARSGSVLLHPPGHPPLRPVLLPPGPHDVGPGTDRVPGPTSRRPVSRWPAPRQAALCWNSQSRSAVIL